MFSSIAAVETYYELARYMNPALTPVKRALSSALSPLMVACLQRWICMPS